MGPQFAYHRPQYQLQIIPTNPNGLSITNHYHILLQDLQHCRDYGAAVICLPETNTNWHLPDLHQKFKNALHRTWPQSQYQTSRSPEEFLSQYQPGGTTTIVCNNWISRIVDRGEDPLGLGSWSYFTLRGKGQGKVTIVTAYNPSTSTGNKANYRQQQHTLSRLHIHYQQHTNANPQRQLFLISKHGWNSWSTQDMTLF